MWKITDFNPASVPIINKLLEDMDKEKPKVVHTTTLPTTDNVNMGELHIYDSGSIRRLYYKTHKGSLQYLTSSNSTEASPDIWPINRGGTNNTTFIAEKFVVFDGVRLISSEFDKGDILDLEDLNGVFVPYLGAVRDVDLGAHSLTVAAGEKIIFDGA